MASGIYTWSTTALDNQNADDNVNWAEGQLPGTVNDSGRGMMKSVAEFIKDINGTVSTGGSSNGYTFTSNGTYASLATGLILGFKANHTNTGAATLTLNALTSKAIRVVTSAGDSALPANSIIQNGHYLVRYDAAANSASGAWILLQGYAIPSAGSATDNAAARFDGTTGALLQTSALLIADTTGSLSRSGNGGIPIRGTNTNDSASSGYVGEVLSNTNTGVGLTTATPANVVTLSLTAGDWDVWGSLYPTFSGGAETAAVYIRVAINTTSATLPASTGNGSRHDQNLPSTLSINPVLSTGTARVSVNATTDVYLVVDAGFSAGSVGAAGSIFARRRR